MSAERARSDLTHWGYCQINARFSQKFHDIWLKKIEHFRSWCLVLVIFRQYYFCFSEANERSFRCATSGRRKMPPFWEKRPRVWRICVFRQCLDFPKSWPDTDCWHQKWLVWIFSLCYGGTQLKPAVALTVQAQSSTKRCKMWRTPHFYDPIDFRGQTAVYLRLFSSDFKIRQQSRIHVTRATRWHYKIEFLR